MTGELVAESYNDAMRDQEMRLGTAPANIEVRPDPALVAKTTDLSAYARIVAGVVGSLALLSPLMLIPGLIVLVLPAEIYAVGWVYDRVMELRTSGTKTSTDGSSVGTVSLETAKTRSTASTLRYPNSHIEGLE
jgi:hypothetical protein